MLRWMVVIALMVAAGLLAVVGTQFQVSAQPAPRAALDQASGRIAVNPPKPLAPAKPRTKARELQKLLETPSDKLRGGIDPGTPLKDALDTIARLASTPELLVNLRIEYALFRQMRQEEPDLVDQKKVGMPAISKGHRVELDQCLRDLLAQHDATYLVRGNEIVVVPDGLVFGHGHWARFLAVNSQFDQTPLADALSELGDLTGISVVLDGAAGDKAKTLVSATLKKVPLTTAVRLLANMADLKPVVIDNVLYVTTEEKARALIDDSAAKPVPLIDRGLAGS